MTGCSRILVRGLVQGVGFRPFVYRLAVSLGARGFVRNISGSSVEIWVEGIDAGLFVEELLRKKPWAAIINNVDVESVECRGYSSFFIEKSAETY
ncbi:MAG: acylphosphatase, partial [Thermosphaera sp.]